MRSYFNYILIVSLVMVMSCKKTTDLDIPNPNEQDESGFWQTANDALMGVTAIYGNFYRNGAPYNRWFPFFMDVRSDDGYSTSGWNELRSISGLNITQYSFEVTNDTWGHHYRGIYRANQVIANVPSIEMDETLKRRYIAEAKFLRALYYYNLVTIWGNIPLVLTPQLPSDRPEQSTPAVVWAQIEQDLSEAAPDLPESYSSDDLGRATRGAAYSLLGRALLQQRKYQQALDALAWLVTGPGAGLYTLVNYEDNFRHTTENNRESIFEVQFKMRSETGAEDAPSSNVGTSRPPFFAPPGHGFTDANMHRWVVREFQQENLPGGQRDPRLIITALFDSADVRGPDFTNVYGSSWTAHNFAQDIQSRVFYRKYLNDYFRINEFEVFNGPVNYRVFRYADVLLMYAECLNSLTRTNEAYQYVDRVRARAGLPALSTTRPGMSQATFQLQLEHERITELTGEGLRWNDLARWGYFEDPAKLALLKARDPEFNNFVIGRSQYMPIPQAEIDVNTNLQQNFGY